MNEAVETAQKPCHVYFMLLASVLSAIDAEPDEGARRLAALRPPIVAVLERHVSAGHDAAIGFVRTMGEVDGRNRYALDAGRGTVQTRFEPLLAIAEASWSHWLDEDSEKAVREAVFGRHMGVYTHYFVESYKPWRQDDGG